MLPYSRWLSLRWSQQADVDHDEKREPVTCQARRDQGIDHACTRKRQIMCALRGWRARQCTTSSPSRPRSHPSRNTFALCLYLYNHQDLICGPGDCYGAFRGWRSSACGIEREKIRASIGRGDRSYFEAHFVLPKHVSDPWGSNRW